MNKTDPSDSFKLEDLETHIQAKNFSIFYRNHKAVAEVNIEIKKGIVTAIIGVPFFIWLILGKGRKRA